MLRQVLMASAAAVFFANSAMAQDVTRVDSVPPEEEEALNEVVVVTGTKIAVTQGGAQDIAYFRDAVFDGAIPAPGTITSEGLFSEYDLPLDTTGRCDQLFCLVAETMDADLLSDSNIDQLVGLGFATNLTTETWDRAPLTVIAVVDKSGSMGGEPLRLAKAAMQETLQNLRPGDQMGVVQYGSTTDLVVPVQPVSTHREAIAAGIDGIFSSGSTYMEAGLELAFETAFEAQADFDGTTRVILFTDERPNVGHTDAGSFIDLARSASNKGVGLTTVGVADHFGAGLANQISSARGGNLFYIQNMEDVTGYFGQDFDFLVSEVAHDLRIRVTPERNTRIETVFGVPGEAITYLRNGGIELTVPSVFLSSKSGGIFLGVSGEALSGQPLANASINYVVARTDEKQSGRLQIASAGPADPSVGLQRAHLLVDEFSVLRAVAEADKFRRRDGRELSLLVRFSDRLGRSDTDKFDEEVELIDELLYTLQDTDYAEPVIDDHPSNYARVGVDVEDPRLNGIWEIVRVSDSPTSRISRLDTQFGKSDLIAFDQIDNMANSQFANLLRGDPAFATESIEIDPDKETITFWDSDTVFEYEIRGDRLTLWQEYATTKISLRRGEEPVPPANGLTYADLISDEFFTLDHAIDVDAIDIVALAEMGEQIGAGSYQGLIGSFVRSEEDPELLQMPSELRARFLAMDETEIDQMLLDWSGREALSDGPDDSALSFQLSRLKSVFHEMRSPDS